MFQINSGASGLGSATRVVMRGMKSIEKDNGVLYVIDGVPMYNKSFGGSGGTMTKMVGSESAADINSDDIESVNMLTGPSAAALYGSDAANGVIYNQYQKRFCRENDCYNQQQHYILHRLYDASDAEPLWQK